MVEDSSALTVTSPLDAVLFGAKPSVRFTSLICAMVLPVMVLKLLAPPPAKAMPALPPPPIATAAAVD